MMPKKRLAKLSDNSIQGFHELRIRVLGAQSIYFYRLLGLTTLIVIFGLVMVLSSSSVDSLKANNDAFYVFLRQIAFAAVGATGLLFASTLTQAFYHRIANLTFFIAVGLQALVFTPLGVDVNGNRAWLKLGPLGTLQPSEFIKLTLILSLAQFLAIRQAEVYDRNRYTFAALGRVITAIGLIILGKDLGTTLVVVIIGFLMIWLSGAPSEYLRGPLVLGALGVGILLFASSSRIGRITSWLNPGTDTANDYAWQSVHGVWALAAGQLTGVGLGGSKMKWSWIPEVENDFIFAIIGEELGMVGALLTIVMFALLGVFLLQIFNRCADTYSKLVVLGVMCWLVIQATVNIAVVLQVLPVLGVPLPLISAGGSSLVAAMTAIGVVLSIERDNHSRLGSRVRAASGGRTVRR